MAEQNAALNDLAGGISQIYNADIPEKHRKKMLKQMGERYLALRAAHGLTEAEMDDLLNKAYSAINVKARAQETGLRAKQAKAGIDPTSGLAKSEIARSNKNTRIAKGRSRVAAEQLDHEMQMRAMGQLMNLPEEPSTFSRIANVVGKGLGTYLALQTGGASTAAQAAGAGAAALGAATQPAYQQQGPSYDNVGSGYMDFYYNPQKRYESGLT